MANTFYKIASVTVGSGGAATMAFTGIPQTYTDLMIKISARTTRAANNVDAISWSFNGLTTNQQSITLSGAGGTPASLDLASFRTLATAATATASFFGNSEIYIANYANNQYKSISADGTSPDNATAHVWLSDNMWLNTAAITSITITDVNSATFVEHSTADLYGIKSS